MDSTTIKHEREGIFSPIFEPNIFIYTQTLHPKVGPW